MCGISGFCNFNQDYLEKKPLWEDTLTKMHLSVAHRGNDNAGTYLTKHVGLAHARLSIRDIENGSQPMLRYQNAHCYAIVYNGEIYNTNELTSELKRAGYSFETTSDTEVILYA